MNLGKLADRLTDVVVEKVTEEGEDLVDRVIDKLINDSDEFLDLIVDRIIDKIIESLGKDDEGDSVWMNKVKVGITIGQWFFLN